MFGKSRFVVLIGCLYVLSPSISCTHNLRAEEESAAKALGAYLANGDESFEWKVVREGKTGATQYAELRLTSQTWRSMIWKHQLFVLMPSTCKRETDHALMFITGGRWREELDAKPGDGDLPGDARLFATIAERLETPVAVLLQVPFQPIFDGKVEDEIISFTFQEYLKSGDPTWPLLLPMVKSAVRGMDATQAVLDQRWEQNIKSFTVSGASKRGWTTWLTGAVDSRARAIAPMVIDVLNMGPQMKHQRASWGDYSAEIDDYSEKGIQELMSTDAGTRLRQIVDPFSYRQQLQQPKLIMIGTNDAYWPVDALNLYWNELQGEKYILYVPNKGHDLGDYGRVIGTMNGFHRDARGIEPMPEMDWEFESIPSGLRLKLKCDEKPDAVQLWTATAQTRDFRKVQWKSRRVAPTDDQVYEIDMDCPADGFCSFFFEASFDRGGLPMFLFNQLEGLGDGGRIEARDTEVIATRNPICPSTGSGRIQVPVVLNHL